MNIKLNNVVKPNSKKMTKIIRSIQTVFAGLAATTYSIGKPTLAFWLLAIAGAADIALSAFSSEDPKNADSAEA